MNSFDEIASFSTLKILGDSQRLAILRALMSEPGTLSQLGRTLGTHPAQVRHHLKQLERAGLVKLVSEQVVRGFVEKYYQATAKAFRINLTITPGHPHKKGLVVMGSHDLALSLLAQNMCADETTVDMVALPVGSLDGLIALRQGFCQLAGCHLLDFPSGEYNVAHIRHLFPGQRMMMMTLAQRQQGLLLKAGNPLKIRDLDDLGRKDVTFVNRKRGSGTRLWLDQQLVERSISGDAIKGYDRTLNTHLEVAQAIAQGEADMGVGIRAAALKFELDFVPLFDERYDLIVTQEALQNPDYAPVFEALQTIEFRNAVDDLGGYDVSETGKVWEVG